MILTAKKSHYICNNSIPVSKCLLRSSSLIEGGWTSKPSSLRFLINLSKSFIVSGTLCLRAQRNTTKNLSDSFSYIQRRLTKVHIGESNEEYQLWALCSHVFNHFIFLWENDFWIVMVQHLKLLVQLIKCLFLCHNWSTCSGVHGSSKWVVGNFIISIYTNTYKSLSITKPTK